MSLSRRDKNIKIKVPVCPHCDAVGKHYGWQCRLNPKNACQYCGRTDHSSLMCLQKPRTPISKESAKTTAKRTATSREWFKLNPPDAKGLWECTYCFQPLTRSTITLDHRLSRARRPDLRYEVSNLTPSCLECNREKGSMSDEEYMQIRKLF